MKSATVAEVKAHLSAYLKASEQGPIVITRKGKPVAVVLAVTDDEELERLLLAHSSHLQAILEAARQRVQAGQGIPNDEFWDELEGKKKPGKQGGKRKKGRRIASAIVVR